MSGTVPPPFRTSTGNTSCPNANRVDTDSDSDIKEDQRPINEFMADLNVVYHEKALLANQKRFYKRYGRVGSVRKTWKKSKETCFACGKLGHFQKDRPLNKTSTPSYLSTKNSFNKSKPYTPSFNTEMDVLVRNSIYEVNRHEVLGYIEYIPPKDDVFPAEEKPLPAAASPTVDSPGYIPESDLDEDPEDDDDEDPKEDPTDYPADDDDEEEEPSGDDADEEDEEQDEDDDDDEEEHPASADSIPPPHALCAGESSAAAAARQIEGRRADYGFVDSVETEIRLWRAEDIRYGIRDT
nr:hypothetical protein [Tanacetum cinerariifolium]